MKMACADGNVEPERLKSRDSRMKMGCAAGLDHARRGCEGREVHSKIIQKYQIEQGRMREASKNINKNINSI